MGITQERDVEKVRAIAKNTKSTNYIKKNIVIETPEEIKEREEKGLPDPNKLLSSSGNEEEQIN